MPSWDPQWLRVLSATDVLSCLEEFGYKIDDSGLITGNGTPVTECEGILIDYLCFEWDYCYRPLEWEAEW